MPVELVPHNPAWSEQFELESKKLLNALRGWAWESGVVFLLEHVGSTSIPDIVAKPCIDIAIGVHPFPLDESLISALQSLGYEYKGENGIIGRQYFRRGPHDVHVHVYEIGHADIQKFTLFRDYLRSDKTARERYGALKLELSRTSGLRASYTDGKSEAVKTLLAEAQNWYAHDVAFRPVEFVTNSLKEVTIPWCFASGWGIDLLLGQVTRYHEDLDICIWRSDQQALLQHLYNHGWKLHVPFEGKYRPWQFGEFLNASIYQVHARKENTPFELLDILFMEQDENIWIYRREPKVTLPKEQVMLKSREETILNPAISLLFKSRTAGKEPRGNDQLDFENTLPYLDTEQKSWLDHAFAIWMPEHPWRSLLK